MKNIIFDFGGVLIDLHLDRTFDKIALLSEKDRADIANDYKKLSFLKEYEMGLMTDAEFRDELRSYIGKDLLDEEIDSAWNAMLGAIPKYRIDKVQELREKHQVFLLSNTNAIHEYSFTKILNKSTGYAHLDELFNQTFYSHRMNMRKPNRDIYEAVLEAAKLNPEETIFLDDTKENLLGAEDVGIKTMHIPYPDFWLEKFYE